MKTSHCITFNATPNDSSVGSRKREPEFSRRYRNVKPVDEKFIYFQIWQYDVGTCIKGIDCTISSPELPGDLFKVLNIARKDFSRYLRIKIFLNCVFQARPTACSLAVEDTNDTSAVVQIPDFEKAV